MNVHGPRTLLRLSRREPAARAATGATFSGGALLGLALASGDVLAIRRCTASSMGPPFTAVWHRDAAGVWTMHVDVAADRTSARFFAPHVDDVRTDDIDFTWKSRRDLVVFVRRARLQVMLRMESTRGARALLAASWLVPRIGPESAAPLRWIGRAAGSVLGTGPLTLAGRTPSGHAFRMQPRALWTVAGAAVVLAGHDLGECTELTERVALGDFVLPRRPVFVVGVERYGEVDAVERAAW